MSLVKPDWQTALSTAIRDPDQLITCLQLPETCRIAAHAASRLFPLMVTESYLQKMESGNPQDPLLLQVLPLNKEQETPPDFKLDAVGDANARRAPGLLHKYHGRALLITTGLCAIHCRYCFRRHYPYQEEPKKLSDWEAALHVLESDRSIKELILSGGDPLMMTDNRLGALIDAITQIPHIRRLRIHSRLPIVLPERITSALIDLLQHNRLRTVVVIHANHANELVADSAEAVARLSESGMMLLNQSVLLRGINDSTEALIALSERLLDLGVMPYYLHQLDRVIGTAHFEVPIQRGIELLKAMQEHLPGYAVPRFVQDLRGAPSKMNIMS